MLSRSNSNNSVSQAVKKSPSLQRVRSAHIEEPSTELKVMCDRLRDINEEANKLHARMSKNASDLEAAQLFMAGRISDIAKYLDSSQGATYVNDYKFPGSRYEMD